MCSYDVLFIAELEKVKIRAANRSKRIEGLLYEDKLKTKKQNPELFILERLGLHD